MADKGNMTEEKGKKPVRKKAAVKANPKKGSGGTVEVDRKKTDEVVQKALDDIYLRQEMVFKIEKTLRQVILGLTVVSIILTGALVFGISKAKTEYLYFMAGQDGMLVQAVPVNRPFQSDEQVLNWFTRAVVEANTWGFADYKEHVREIKPYFSDKAYVDYISGLNNTGFFKKLREGYFMITAVPKGAPVVIQKAVQGGVLHYMIEMPLVQTWKSAKREYKVEYIVKAVVQRVPVHERPSGLAIKQIVMQVKS